MQLVLYIIDEQVEVDVYDEVDNLYLDQKHDIDEVDELVENEVMVVTVELVEIDELEYVDIDEVDEVDIVGENIALDNDVIDEVTDDDVMLHDVEVDDEVEVGQHIENDDDESLRYVIKQTEVVDFVQLHDELKHYVIDIVYTHSQVMVRLPFHFSFNS